MRRPLVAGNWKMNGLRADTRERMERVVGRIGDVSGCDVVVCPPFPLLDTVAACVRSSPAIGLGAQNLSARAGGAHTGEVSGAMLRDAGCRYVIVGHSERRALYGESDEVVAEKVATALAHDLVPVVCVGESLDERESGATLDVVGRQLDAVLAQVGVEGLARGLVAYEPVWAIGTGRTATPAQAQEVHAAIRARVQDTSAEVGASLRILYGGSVRSGNAEALFAEPDIDGGLIGGASLDADEFIDICSVA
jgi:triosephosphate isomerase (TIM)